MWNRGCQASVERLYGVLAFKDVLRGDFAEAEWMTREVSRKLSKCRKDLDFTLREIEIY